MTKFNDIDINDWKTTDIETDSLWIIKHRDNLGKHDGSYHGNFVPQIPRQLLKRYTKQGDYILDPFVGSGTSVYEAESLKRKFIGIDIQQNLVDEIKQKLDDDKDHIFAGDSTKKETFRKLEKMLLNEGKEKVQFVLLHPPYSDIIKFSNQKEDISNIGDLSKFRRKFKNVLKNCMEILEDSRYLAIVIGDKYTNGEWIPLGFYLMSDAQSLGLKLKSIIIKNMAGNRAKQNKESIWKYRALKSDYYIFKHEYILVFKKEG